MHVKRWFLSDFLVNCQLDDDTFCNFGDPFRHFQGFKLVHDPYSLRYAFDRFLCFCLGILMDSVLGGRGQYGFHIFF